MYNILFNYQTIFDGDLFILFICLVILIGILTYIISSINRYKKIIGGTVNSNEIDRNIALIIPFGDLNPEEGRSGQLYEFLKHIPNVLPQSYKFTVVVAEQISPEKYFNRGQLLNIAAKYINNHIKPYLLIFHDVDMLPDKKLANQYINNNSLTCLSPPNSNTKYYKADMSNLCGGAITSIKSDIFEKINGYPNNFWGWGGEDNAFINRIKTNNVHYVINTKGKYKSIDIHRLTPEINDNSKNKMDYLKKNKISNMMRRELIRDDRINWSTNGLGQLDNLNYEISNIEHRVLSDNCNLVILKIKLDTINLNETIEHNEQIYKTIAITD